MLHLALKNSIFALSIKTLISEHLSSYQNIIRTLSAYAFYVKIQTKLTYFLYCVQN